MKETGIEWRVEVSAVTGTEWRRVVGSGGEYTYRPKPAHTPPSLGLGSLEDLKGSTHISNDELIALQEATHTNII